MPGRRKQLFSFSTLKGRGGPGDGRGCFPVDVPKGHVRVYVGKDIIYKFEQKANYLNHPLFEDLLRLSVEEFGYSYKGALRIACEINLFFYLLRVLKSGNPWVRYMELHDLMIRFYGGNGGGQEGVATSS